MELALFLGRFHVLVLHLPIGIILTVVALELCALTTRFRHLAAAAPSLWLLAAVTAVVTAALGFMHVAEGGFDPAAVAAHRSWGIALALVTCGIWLLRSRLSSLHRFVIAAVAVATVPIMIATGHYGGQLTHGTTYLTEHAPQRLLDLAGVERTSSSDSQAGAAGASAVAAPELGAAGFRARPVALETGQAARWIVSAGAPGTELADDALAALATTPRAVVELNLPGLGLEDADLAFLASLTGLEVLRLDSNLLTDETIRIVSGLPAVRVLNVYGNMGITDSSVDLLASMPALRSVYVWQTGITSAGAARLRELRPELLVQLDTARSLLEEFQE